MEIRLADVKDSADLLKIYAQYVDASMTFECVLPKEQEFAKGMAGILKDYPYLVCREEGVIIGYAYADRHRDREACQWNAELCIYLDQKYVSWDLGRQLYQCLMEILKVQGIRNVYGCVTIPNEKREELHTSLGFKRIGIDQKSGFKKGEWMDVVWFGKQIGPYDRDPVPVLSVSEIDRAVLEELLEHANTALVKEACLFS